MSASVSSSSAASITAAIYDSKDYGREQVSDVVHNTTGNVDDNVSNNDASNNKDKETDEDVFFGVARKIMNQTNKKLDAAATEECQFCSFFGVWNEIMLKVWSMLGGVACAPGITSPSICFMLSIF